jgi:hypothetical protein|tara:strand:+ start:838 stop:1317 length:480 start_codon:yes stop_codon:yes gene_type:complete
MNFTRQSRPLKDNINNAIVNVTHGVPMKAGHADGSNDFSINRFKYVRTTNDREGVTNQFQTYEKFSQDVENAKTKRYFGNTNTDSVSRIAKIREKAIGGGSLNLPKISYDAQGNGVVTSVNLPMSFVDTKSINTIDQAVRRTRSGGASVPKKFSINKNA